MNERDLKSTYAMKERGNTNIKLPKQISALGNGMGLVWGGVFREGVHQKKKKEKKGKFDQKQKKNANTCTPPKSIMNVEA